MRLTQFACASAPDTLRIWVGAFEATALPRLTWTLDGVPVIPTPVRAIESVRGKDWLDYPGTPRAFTGVYDFGRVASRKSVRVEVTAGGVANALETRTLPPAIPSSGMETFNVLLVSCFHSTEDKEGTLGAVISRLPEHLRPNLTVLLGDQVYLDLPPENFPGDTPWLAAKFEADYTKNWIGEPGWDGYSSVFRLAPVVCVPDDHEYWNNAPHPSPFIQNSYTRAGRDQWRTIARRMYQAFQHTSVEPVGSCERVDIEPLSFLFADTRSDRQENLSRSLAVGQLERVRRWSEALASGGPTRFGVFVSGQQVIDTPADWWDARIADRTLANYQDFKDLFAALEHAKDRAGDVLTITGDVHWGRVARYSGGGALMKDASLFEVISSPSSLCSLLGAQKAVWNQVIGREDPWERHSEAPDAPTPFLSPSSNRYTGETLHKQPRSNHCCVLSFRRIGDDLHSPVEVRAHYLQMSLKAGVPAPTKPFHLTPRSPQ